MGHGGLERLAGMNLPVLTRSVVGFMGAPPRAGKWNWLELAGIKWNQVKELGRKGLMGRIGPLGSNLPGAAAASNARGRETEVGGHGGGAAVESPSPLFWRLAFSA